VSPALFPQLSSSIKVNPLPTATVLQATWEGGLTEESQETCQSDTDFVVCFRVKSSTGTLYMRLFFFAYICRHTSGFKQLKDWQEIFL
jgi:hypothetical protein